MNGDMTDTEVREAARWYCLVAVKKGSYVGASETWIQDSIRKIFPLTATEEWVREQLDYLSERGLLTLNRRVGQAWWVRLTRYGHDVVDFTVPCDAGIARPPRT